MMFAKPEDEIKYLRKALTLALQRIKELKEANKLFREDIDDLRFDVARYKKALNEKFDNLK